MKFLSCNSVLLAALYCVSVTTTTAFTQPMNINNMPQCAARSSTVDLQSHANDSGSSMQSQSRARFLSTFAAAVVTTAVGVSGSALPADAADSKIDPAVKGTKKDPGYEACVSQCMYECTKPKGNEQMSRSQCLPGCKKQCATTKAQLMVGTPLPDAAK
jgi:hypothetical protein